ncbi:hypothetical protein Tco_1292697 [Tanacetum coccineum]
MDGVGGGGAGVKGRRWGLGGGAAWARGEGGCGANVGQSAGLGPAVSGKVELVWRGSVLGGMLLDWGHGGGRMRWGGPMGGWVIGVWLDGVDLEGAWGRGGNNGLKGAEQLGGSPWRMTPRGGGGGYGIESEHWVVLGGRRDERAGEGCGREGGLENKSRAWGLGHRLVRGGAVGVGSRSAAVVMELFPAGWPGGAVEVGGGGGWASWGGWVGGLEDMGEGVGGAVPRGGGPAGAGKGEWAGGKGGGDVAEGVRGSCGAGGFLAFRGLPGDGDTLLFEWVGAGLMGRAGRGAVAAGRELGWSLCDGSGSGERGLTVGGQGGRGKGAGGAGGCCTGGPTEPDGGNVGVGEDGGATGGGRCSGRGGGGGVPGVEGLGGGGDWGKGKCRVATTLGLGWLGGGRGGYMGGGFGSEQWGPERWGEDVCGWCVLDGCGWQGSACRDESCRALYLGEEGCIAPVCKVCRVVWVVMRWRWLRFLAEQRQKRCGVGADPELRHGSGGRGVGGGGLHGWGDAYAVRGAVGRVRGVGATEGVAQGGGERVGLREREGKERFVDLGTKWVGGKVGSRGRGVRGGWECGTREGPGGKREGAGGGGEGRGLWDRGVGSVVVGVVLGGVACEWPGSSVGVDSRVFLVLKIEDGGVQQRHADWFGEVRGIAEVERDAGWWGWGGVVWKMNMG